MLLQHQDNELSHPPDLPERSADKTLNSENIENYFTVKLPNINNSSNDYPTLSESLSPLAEISSVAKKVNLDLTRHLTQGDEEQY